MKKLMLITVMLIVLFSFTACTVNPSNTTEDENIDSGSSLEKENDILKILCNGAWYINTEGKGTARGEGRYVDYITFHTDGTYEKKQLVSSYFGDDTYLTSAMFKVVDDYIIAYDYQECDYVFQLNEANNELILLNEIIRVYDDHSPRFYYADEFDINFSKDNNQGYDSLEACLLNLNAADSYHKYRLYNETDEIRIKILSGIWAPQSWQSSTEPDTMVFSRDGYCYIWNSSYFDNDDVDIFSEFYEIYNYEIDDSSITINNGMKLSIASFDSDEIYLIDSDTQTRYGLS